MNQLDTELNEYLNPLLFQLMGDSFDTLKGLYQEGGLKELQLNELEFFQKFIIDTREFYTLNVKSPDRLEDLNIIEASIKKLIPIKNNS